MDLSELDQKYFTSNDTYNCPFCKRRHVSFKILGASNFNWTSEKVCFLWLIQCKTCENKSMHLTFNKSVGGNNGGYYLSDIHDLDKEFFYSVPTSSFSLDSRIPTILRELIIEAEACLKMNLLTGASACVRKAIYELTVTEKADGADYEARIKSLKSKFPAIPTDYFDVLCHIKDMTSDKVHEQSWDKWDNKHLGLFLTTLRQVLHEIYIVPEERKKGIKAVSELLDSIKGAKTAVKEKAPKAS